MRVIFKQFLKSYLEGYKRRTITSAINELLNKDVIRDIEKHIKQSGIHNKKIENIVVDTGEKKDFSLYVKLSDKTELVDLDKIKLGEIDYNELETIIKNRLSTKNQERSNFYSSMLKNLDKECKMNIEKEKSLINKYLKQKIEKDLNSIENKCYVKELLSNFKNSDNGYKLLSEMGIKNITIDDKENIFSIEYIDNDNMKLYFYIVADEKKYKVHDSTFNTNKLLNVADNEEYKGVKHILDEFLEIIVDDNNIKNNIKNFCENFDKIKFDKIKRENIQEKICVVENILNKLLSNELSNIEENKNILSNFNNYKDIKIDICENKKLFSLMLTDDNKIKPYLNIMVNNQKYTIELNKEFELNDDNFPFCDKEQSENNIEELVFQIFKYSMDKKKRGYC